MRTFDFPARSLAAGGLAIGAMTLALASYSNSDAGDQDPRRDHSTGLQLQSSAAVLTRPSASADVLPPDLLMLPVADRFDRTSLAGTRMVGTSGGRTYWAIPGLQGELCFVVASGAADTFESAGTCALRSQLGEGGIWFSETGASGEKIALLLPDGVDRVSTPDAAANVENNFTVIEVSPSDNVSLTLSNDAGDTSEFYVGDFTPPE